MIQLNSKNAEAAYFVSNTPVYFIRRILEDKAVQELARSASSDELLFCYRSLSQAMPESMSDLVLPYCCLAALFIKNDGRKLKLATAIRAHPGYKWLEEIARTFLEMLVPTTVINVKVAPTVKSRQPITGVSINNVKVLVTK